MIVSWPGTTPAGVVNNDLTDFSDFLPTIAELCGVKLSTTMTMRGESGFPAPAAQISQKTKLPSGSVIDGYSFAAQLRGQAIRSRREWCFVELGNKWYVRDARYKLTSGGELFDLQNAPYEEKPVADANGEAKAARKRLQVVLDELNPAGGKQDEGDGSGRHQHKKKTKKAQGNQTQ